MLPFMLSLNNTTTTNNNDKKDNKKDNNNCPLSPFISSF